MANAALFIGGPLNGMFSEYDNPQRVVVPYTDEEPGLRLVPTQGAVEPSYKHAIYKSGAYFLGPYISRKIFVLEGMDEEDVEDFLAIFMADLWDECEEDSTV